MLGIKRALTKALEIICIILFAFITCVGSYQIITRYVFNAPSTISEELLTYSFTWLALLATALVFGKRDHMRMSFVADKFTGTGDTVLKVISEVLVFLFAGIILLFGGIEITKLTMTQITASLGVPMGYIYIIVPISGVITMIFSVLNIIEILSESDERGVVK